MTMWKKSHAKNVVHVFGFRFFLLLEEPAYGFCLERDLSAIKEQEEIVEKVE